MALGFGYVRDSKPTQIDWQDIGKQMSDNIGLEMVDRQKRKDAIDTKLGEYKKALLDQPQGTNAETNRFFSDFTGDAGEAMRNAERLLKNGDLAERDFYKFRANATQGTDLLFTAGKKFNEGYDESMRRFSEGESQSLENYMRQQTEGFLNFANNGAFINPLTGEVNVARRDKVTGEISTDPGDFANASQLVQQAVSKYNKYDLNAAVNGAVEGLAAVLIQESDGRTTKQFFQALQDGTLDAEEVALLDKAKKDMVASFTVNEYNVTSILTENIGALPVNEGGASYDFTPDKTEAKNNPHLILVNPDGTIDFTTKNGKAQLEAAKKYAEARFESSLGGSRKEAPEKIVKEDSDASKKAAKGKEKEVGFLQTINNAFTGNQEMSRGAIDAMVTKYNRDRAENKPELLDIVRSKDGKTMTIIKENKYNQRTEVPINIEDPSLSAETFINLVYGNEIDSSYKQILNEYNNREGGFTPKFLYTTNDAGEEVKLQNPEYGNKGTIEVAVGRTKSVSQPINFAIDKIDPTDNKGDTVSQAFTNATSDKEVNSIISNLINRLAPKVFQGFNIINPDDDEDTPNPFSPGPDLFVIKTKNGEEIILGKTDDKPGTLNNLQNLFNGEKVNGFQIEDGIIKKG